MKHKRNRRVQCMCVVKRTADDSNDLVARARVEPQGCSQPKCRKRASLLGCCPHRLRSSPVRDQFQLALAQSKRVGDVAALSRTSLKRRKKIQHMRTRKRHTCSKSPGHDQAATPQVVVRLILKAPEGRSRSPPLLHPRFLGSVRFYAYRQRSLTMSAATTGTGARLQPKRSPGVG